MSSNSFPVADEVLSVISQLGQQNLPLELTKSYRGILLQQDVNILEVKPDGATFRVKDIEMCTALHGEVYLHNRLFPKPVMAHFKSLDISKGRLVLSGFVYKDIEWKKRQHERVQPKGPNYATLHWRGKAARACIDNISVDGIGVFAHNLSERGLKLQPGSNIHLDFQLSPDHKYSGLKGIIVYLNTTGQFSAIMGVRLFPKVKEARLLERYIARRKQEILGELNQAYWEMSTQRGVESLYF